MTELAINQLIKIILGIIVLIAIIIALYIFFKDNIIAFFKGIGGTETEIILSLLK